MTRKVAKKKAREILSKCAWSAKDIRAVGPVKLAQGQYFGWKGGVGWVLADRIKL